MLKDNPMINFEDQINALEPYLKRILVAHGPDARLAIIDGHPLVREYLKDPFHHYPFLQGQDPKFDLPIRSIIAIGQGPIVFNSKGIHPDQEDINQLLNTLLEIEKFYGVIGGILGYHLTILKLISGKHIEPLEADINYRKPLGIDISKESPEVRKMIRQGLEQFSHLAEIYPLGGAGDRLNLQNEHTGEHLPAARLLFCGRTLLEGLVRDLQAREYLYYKLFGKQLTTPMAMMTSNDKNNHQHITEICSDNEWFGRPRGSFVFMIQAMAPLITREGHWSLSAPFSLTMKPGGHGVIWKLALEQGVFHELEAQGRTKAIVRQINNPMAGIDYGLLAFSGIGFERNFLFGFASCPRLLNTAEGMNVLIEKKLKKKYEYCIANIEYTEFSKKGVHDIPESANSPYSAFPANTNILFVDLKAIKQAVKSCPFPGKTINMKNQVPCILPDGHTRTVEGGRLETTMQNITDCIVNSFNYQIKDEEQEKLSTYITYNQREKTISATKKSYSPGNPLAETPEGCFYDLLKNNRDLLMNYCKMDIPALDSEQEYLNHGPSFIALLHPALGPLYSVIGQKIQGGKLSKGSDIQLEIAELEISNLHLEGSLHINSEAILGKEDNHGLLKYGELTGKCVLKNVTVKNAGIDKSAKNCYWKNWITHKEIFSVVLRGNAEFHAEDVILKGSQHIEVQDGQRMIAFNNNGQVQYRVENISKPTWHWSYSFDKDDKIILKKK